MSNTIKIQNLTKSYNFGKNKIEVLKGINTELPLGKLITLMGPSGSGKTTLLNVIATIDEVSSGHIYLNGKDLTEINKKEIGRFRRENLGFIFQDFNLIDTLTIHENIALALTINKTNKNERNHSINS